MYSYSLLIECQECDVRAKECEQRVERAARLVRRAAAGEEAQARWLDGTRSLLAQPGGAAAAAAGDARRTSATADSIARDAAELQVP